MALQIRKARRSKAWLKLVIDGVSGSGKTYSSLQIAKGIGPEPRVLLIDTENGSGELYSHLYEYDYIRLSPPFSPTKYVEAIEAAIANGNNIVIIDSLSHCWKYIGAYKDTLDATNPKAGFTNWTKAKLLFDEVKTALLQCPAHVICTLRAGSEYAESYDVKGNKRFDKVGTKPIAEPDLEYEFTLALRIERSHLAAAVKDRTEKFDIAAPFTPSPTTGRTLWAWLNEGEGELFEAWGGVFHNEESKMALSEAQRIGVGNEGSTEDELARKATELLNQKRKEANAKIAALGLDQDKAGLKTFADKAKTANLDPLELFWEFSKKREGLKTWAEFQLILDEYVVAKNEAEKVGGKSESSPTTSTPGSEGEVSPTSTEGPKTSNGEGEGNLFESSGGSEKTDGAGQAEEKPSSDNSSPNSESLERLKKAFGKSPDKILLLKRSDALGVSVDDLIAEAVSRSDKAGLPQLVTLIEELENRGR